MQSRNGINMPMGVFEPVVCTAGFYCPRGGREQIKCSRTHYCPLGSIQPQQCDWLSYCPSGAQVQYIFLPLTILVLIDLALIVVPIFTCIFLGQARQTRERAQVQRISSLYDWDDYKQCHDLEKGQPVVFAKTISRDDRSDDLHNKEQGSMASAASQTFLESMQASLLCPDSRLSLDFEKLTFTPKGQSRPVLHDISGQVRAGKLTGVMGGSGAGKSMFLNALMGRLGQVSGTISVNGARNQLQNYKKVVGHVPQDDIVLSELTVRENIMHSARIRLPSNWSRKAIYDHVETVLESLDLSHVADSQIGTVARPLISGGQRKRTSIGIELVAAPLVLFLDEPTSGLDAHAASSIISILKALSQSGITVIVTIHQPRMEIFDMMDDLILLANGQVVYQGLREDVKEHFEDLGFSLPALQNEGDVITDIITGNGSTYHATGGTSMGALIAHWQAMNTRDEHVTTQDSMENDTSLMETCIKQRGAGFLKQLYYCLERALLQQYRLKSSFWFEMSVAAFSGLLLGLAQNPKKGAWFRSFYYEPYDLLSSAPDFTTASQVALLLCIAIGITTSSPAVKVFTEERLMFRREAQSGHGRSAYYIAKVFSTLPRICLGCLHFTTFFMLIGTPLFSFRIAYLVTILYFFCIYGLASIVAMFVCREDAPLLATMASLVVAVLSGTSPTLAKAESWHVAWLWRLSPGTWLAEALWSKSVVPWRHVYELEPGIAATGYKTDRVMLDCAMLLVIGLAYRILGFLGLLFNPRSAY